MANLIYAVIKGKKQGLISAGCSTYSSIGNLYQAGHEDEIMVLSLETEISRAQHVNHQPVMFIKPIDKSTPLLGMAISDNEELDITFTEYRTSSSGANERYFTRKLRGAFLERIKTLSPHTQRHNDKQPEELILVRYATIQWEHHLAGTSGYSIWDERAY
ncbi:Hcp family type VI secretion system effector [Erwiniaceae bacterium CAU 1747]